MLSLLENRNSREQCLDETSGARRGIDDLHLENINPIPQPHWHSILAPRPLYLTLRSTIKLTSILELKVDEIVGLG